MQYELPGQLAALQADFEKTVATFIAIHPIEGEKATWLQSRIGGYPFLPVGTEYPKSTNGKHLLFLAQINCSELPEQDFMPKSGLLQFYIFDDSSYGYRAKSPAQQDFFRVIYYPEDQLDALQIQTDFAFLRKMNRRPIKGGGKSWPIEFDTATEWCPSGDFHFSQLLGADYFGRFGAQNWDQQFEYDNVVSAAGHKIGGYADFAGPDPRSPEDPMLLLLQLDSDDEVIDWGDFGLVNFFIRQSDVDLLDFSKVQMHWDNGEI